MRNRATPFGGSAYGAGGGISPAIRSLILANGVVFLIGLIAVQLGGGRALYQLFGLVPANFWRGMLWQPFTYLFLHDGVMHILFNMLALWMFGREVEEQWGTRAFVTYYFVCGVGAGLCVALVSIGSSVPTVGASGAIFGLLLAYAILFPDRIILFMFLFPMKAKYAAALFGLIELLVLLSNGPNSGGVSQVAHLGGALVGYLYLRYEYPLRMWWFDRRERRRRRVEEADQRREGEWRTFIADELDPILEKISREGIHTLTERERKLLRRGKDGRPRRRER